jgi:hypothetical protein
MAHNNEHEDRVVDNGFELEQHQHQHVDDEHRLSQHKGSSTRLMKEEEASVEKVFKHLLVPSWRNQLTIRAFVVSFFLSVLFSFIVMKLNLTTGIIPSLNVSAGLLGFFFVKTWTKFLEKSDMLKQPFTRQENTVIQTCVVASSGIAFSGKFSSSSHFLQFMNLSFLL